MPKHNKITSKNRKGLEFYKLEVNVFKNKRNGQQTIMLPKKMLENIPPKMNIKIPIEFFKNMKGGQK